jgi:hypothetical protein
VTLGQSYGARESGARPCDVRLDGSHHRTGGARDAITPEPWISTRKRRTIAKGKAECLKRARPRNTAVILDMKMDLRQPTLVIAGAWNPAIFSLEWIATNVLGKKENDTLKFTEVMDATGKGALYFDEIGIGASVERLNIYCNDFEQKQAAEKMSETIIGLLSHTPITGVGINFSFSQENCDTVISDKMQTKEGITAYRKIISQRFKTAIEIEPELTLNFDRILSAGNVAFNFNYHHAANSAVAAVKKIGNSIERCYADALDLMSKLYELENEDVEYLRHKFPL